MTEPTSTYSQPLFTSTEPEPHRVDLVTPGDTARASARTEVKPEEPRRHPVAYLALVLSVISLLWLTIWSANSGGDSYQKVRVGSQDCVSVPQDTGPAALYCRTVSTVK